MEQEDDDDDRDGDRLFDERSAQRGDRLTDEPGSIVGRYDFHTRRHRLPNLVQLRLHALDDIQGVLAKTHHDDAADDFASAIEVRNASPDVRSQPDLRNVPHTNRRATRVGAQRHLLEVGDRGQIAATTNHVLAPGKLQEPPFDVVVAHLDRVDDVFDADVVGGQLVRIEVHLVLLDEAADACDLCDARHGCEPVAEMPVLEAAELREGVPTAFVQERVLEDPAHTGRIRTDGRVDLLRQLSSNPLQVLDDAAPRPVHVGAVLEDDVDVRNAEIGEAADRFDARGRDQSRDDRVGDLILDEIGAAADPLGRDDDLDIRNVGDGVERRLRHGPDAPRRQHDGSGEHHETIRRAPIDGSVDHHLHPRGAHRRSMARRRSLRIAVLAPAAGASAPAPGVAWRQAADHRARP